jgi:hypothetical protein
MVTAAGMSVHLKLSWWAVIGRHYCQPARCACGSGGAAGVGVSLTGVDVLTGVRCRTTVGQAVV